MQRLAAKIPYAQTLSLGGEHSVPLRPLLERIEDASDRPQIARVHHTYWNNDVLTSSDGQKFFIGRCIGRGAFGKVHVVATYEGTDRKLYARKSQKSSPPRLTENGEVCLSDPLRMCLQEVEMMRKAGSGLTPSRIFLTYDSHKAFRLDMIMPLMDSTLKQLIEQVPFGDTQARSKLADGLFGQLGSALTHLHAQGVYLRDIKPENILIDRKGVFEFCDFGFATSASTHQQGVGTLDYMAPESLPHGFDSLELYNQYAPRPVDSKAADLWQFGVVLAQTLAGRIPFDLRPDGSWDEGAVDILTQSQFIAENLAAWTHWPTTKNFAIDAASLAEPRAYPARWLATYMQDHPAGSRSIAATFALLRPEPKERVLLAAGFDQDTLTSQTLQLAAAVSAIDSDTQDAVVAIERQLPATYVPR